MKRMRTWSLAALLALCLIPAARAADIHQGEISYASEVDAYSFQLPAPAWYYFDSLTNNGAIRWSLSGPPGQVVLNRSFTGTDSDSIGDPLLRLPAGDYELSVSATSANTGGYHFRLLDLAEAALISPGTVISDNAFLDRSTDAYQFTAQAGDTMTFDALSTANGSAPYWRLIDPYGRILFGNYFADVNSRYLESTGTYLLLVEGRIGGSATSYSFQVNLLSSNPPPPFSGTPLIAGVGITNVLSSVGETNAYTFTLPQTTWIHPDLLIHNRNLRYAIYGPGGTMVNTRDFYGAGTVHAAPTGDYQIVISAVNNYTGTYALRLVDFADASPMTPGTVVNGVNTPAASLTAYQFEGTAGTRYFFDAFSKSGYTYFGNAWMALMDPYGQFLHDGWFNDAGNLTLTGNGTYTLWVGGGNEEPGAQGTFSFNLLPITETSTALAFDTVYEGSVAAPGQQHRYTFSLNEVKQVHFQSLTNQPAVRWMLEGPAGLVQSSVAFNSVSGWFVPTLQPGDYTLTVFANGDATGGYRFELMDAALTTPFAIGDTVNGTLTPAASLNLHEIELTAGDRLFVDALSQSGYSVYGTCWWRMEDPEGNVVYLPDVNITWDRGFGDIGPFTVQRSGTYRLFIAGSVIEPQPQGNYSFRILRVNDAASPIAFGQTIEAVIDSPGERITYSFSVAVPSLIEMDHLKPVAGLRWTLAGEDREYASNVGFNSESWYLYHLEPGDYTLTVSPSGDSLGTAQFRLLDLVAATPLTFGTVVNGVCTPAPANQIYRFQGTAGQRLFFDVLSQSGFTVYGQPFWVLLAPGEQTVFDGGFGDGIIELNQTGEYKLIIRGHLNEPQPTANFSFVINNVPIVSAPLVLDAVTSGTLNPSGARRRYTFSLNQWTQVVFDNRLSSVLRWTLTGPDGVVFNNRALNSSDGPNGDSFANLPLGDYTLDVHGAGDAVGDYSFVLRTLVSGSALALNSTVNDSLDPANVTRLFRFNAAAGDHVRIQALSQTGMGSSYWRLRGPQGDLIWNSYFNNTSHSNLLSWTGSYTLLLEGAIADSGTGTFSFSSTTFTPTPPPPPSGSAIALNEIVSDTLPTAATVNSYLLTLTQPGRLYLDPLKPMDNLRWTFIGPNGPIVQSQPFQTGLAVQLFAQVLPPGNYELQITGTINPYSFRFLDFDQAPLLSLGTVVNQEIVPASGAVLHRVNLTAGEPIYFDTISESGFSPSPWKRLWGPAGQQIFFISSATDSGTIVPNQSGEHYLSLDGPWQNPGATGTVSFAMNAVGYTTNALLFGSTITGSLDPTGGDVDTFTFTLTETNRVFFDVMNMATFNWNWSLSGPYGDEVVNRSPLNTDGLDVGDSSLLLRPGTYRMQIRSTTTASAPYSFRVLRAKDAPALTLGGTISTNLAPAAATALWRFQGTAGELIYYDFISRVPSNHGYRLRLFSPAGALVQNRDFNSDADAFSLPMTGEYVVSVEGRVYDANAAVDLSYAFRPVTHVEHPLTLDTIASDTISVPGTRHQWSFSLATAQTLFFDALTNAPGAAWTLTRADNVLVSNRGFLGSDGIDIGSSRLNLPAGDYVITVALGLNNTGTYAFRLVSPASATPMLADTDIAVPVDPPMATRLLSFPGVAGDQFYFDGRPMTGSGNFVVRFYDPIGNLIFGRSTDDQPTFTLPYSGTYLVSVEGRIYNSGAGFTANFALISNPPKPVDPLFETTTLPDLVVNTIGVTPSVGLKSGDPFTVSWTVRNNGVAATANAFTDRVLVRNTTLNQIVLNSTLPYNPADAGNGPIEPGTQRSRQLAMALPAGASGAGAFEVTVTTDSANQVAEYNVGGTGEANNGTTTTFSSSLSPYPDLQILNLAASPPTGWSVGSVVQFSWSITNTGPAAASTSWVDRVIVRNVSRSAVLLSTNVVHNFNTDGALLSGGLRSRTAQFVVPSGLNGQGEFSISIETDALAAVVEAQSDGSGEDNNLASITVRSAPDLQVTGVNVTPSPSAQSGADLLVEWTLNNTGSAPVETSFSDRVQVRNFDTGATLLNTTSGYNPASVGNGAIVPGTTRNRSLTVKLPDGQTAVGNLQIEVSADTYNQVFELTAVGSGESDNSANTSLTTTLAPYPDLLVANVTVTPPNPLSGQEITIRWDDVNQGTAPVTGNWHDRVLVENVGSAATLLNTTVYHNTGSLGELANGSSHLRQYVFRLPNGLAGSGQLRVTVTADTLASVYEYNGGGTAESNNSASTDFTSTLAAYPDLEVATFELTPTTFESGRDITANWSLTNSGTAAVAGDFYDRLLVRNLTLGSTISDRSYYLNPVADANGPIAPGQVRNRTATFRLPDGSAGAGNIEVALFLDSGNRIFEFRDGLDAEGNNSTNVARTSTVALYPNLAVNSVASPATGLPGQPIDVSWTVVNNGVAVTPAARTDQVFLVDDASPNTPQLLGSFTFGDALGVGGSTNVTRSVTLPFFAVGTRRLAVRANSNQGFYEADFADNYATAAATISLSPRLELTLNRSSAPENAGDNAVFLTVLRNGSTAADLTVNLSSSDPNSASVTTVTTIPAGQTYRTLAVTLINNSLVDGSRTVTLGATASGFSPGSIGLLVQDEDQPTLTLQTSSSTVAEDAGVAAIVGYLSRNTPTADPLTVTVISDSPTQLLPPATVIIPAGQASVGFDIAAPLNTTIEGPRDVRLQTSASNFRTGTAIVTVIDNDAPTIALELAAEAVVEGAESPATTGRVTRQPPLTAPLNVVLSQTIPGLLLIPAELNFAAGESEVEFNINVSDDFIVNGTRTNILAARIRGVLGVPIANGEALATLKVFDNDGPSLSLALARDVVSETGSVNGTVSRNTGTVGSLVVDLSSNDTGEAVPALPTVTIPNGASSVGFTINGVSDGINDGIQPTIITAVATGYNSATARLNVTDVDLPDLAVGDIIVPSSGQIDARANVTFTVANTGPVPASGSWVDRVFISTDNQLGGDILAGAVTNSMTLDINSAYTRTLSITLPPNPGNYHVIVVTDADNTLVEGSERNNVISIATIDVQPSYRATVETAIVTAPCGTPVPITGRAYNPDDNSPARLRHVTVRILRGGTRRVFNVFTDLDGTFQMTFTPLPMETGDYQLAADHPLVREDTPQDNFSLLGFSVSAEYAAMTIVPETPVSGQITIRNETATPLTGVAANAPDAPASLGLELNLASTLAGHATTTLDWSLNTTITNAARVVFPVILTSNEGCTRRVLFTVNIAPLRPQLVSEPSFLERGVVRGEQALVSFKVRNVGGVASGPLDVIAPNVDWISLASEDELPSLEPGEETTINALLNPPADLPLTIYTGNFAVGNSRVSLSEPFRFRSMSTAQGDLLITATDDYTYYVADSPNVAGAQVTVSDPFTGQTVTNGVTDAAGEVRFIGLTEGAYVIDVSAPKHNTFRGTATIQPGVETALEAFMIRQTVTYRWSVVPVEVEDRYRIVLESVFETEVPVPNVVIEEPHIMPLVFEGETNQFEITLRNEGLIAAENVEIIVPDSPNYLIEPLVRRIGTMPAKSRLTIPVLISARTAALGSPQLASFDGRAHLHGGGNCEIDTAPCFPKIQLGVRNFYICGPNGVWQERSVDLSPVCLVKDAWDCIKDTLKAAGSLHDFRNGGNIANLGCDLIAAILQCAGVELSACQKAAISIACGALTGGVAGAAGGAANGDTLECICGLIKDLNISLPTAPPNYGSVTYGGGLYGGSLRGAFNGLPWGSSWALGPGTCASSIPTPAPGLNSPSPGLMAEGVCARVRVQIEQEAVMTRVAFRGSLEIENNSGTAITGIRVTIDVRDAAGNPAGDRFVVAPPVVTGMGDVDGTGSVTGFGIGRAEYLFRPTRDAAPTAPAVYRIGGSLRYLDNGQEVVVPLLSSTITVYPEARLELHYFQARNVYSDDPFTDEIEPAEPFSLGLLARNLGAGPARNFRITSAQPKIIENQKGLLIDFKIIGSQVGTNAAEPSLTVNLGDIAPGKSQVAQWLMTSSLQGKFIEYSATFEHIDNFGSTNLSLIDSVQIHELIKTVLADRSGDDLAPDFLANDIPDPNSLPDILYLSDGSSALVNGVTNGTFSNGIGSGARFTTLTFTPQAGWMYLTLPDPGPGWKLRRVTRSDNKQLLVGTNVWTTDRTFPSAISGVVREHRFHLFDFDSTGSYTLEYRPVDTVAPTLVSVGPVTPSFQTVAINEVEVVFSEEIDAATFGPTDVSLSRDGSASLINGGVTFTQTATNRVTVGGLAALTGVDGNYQLSVNAAGVEDFAGNAGVGSLSTFWAKGSIAPVVTSLGPVTPNPRNVPVDSLEVVFSRAINTSTFTREDLVLARNGGANLIDTGVNVSALDVDRFLITGLTLLTQTAGDYSLAINTVGLEDTDGNAGAGVGNIQWSMITTGPQIVAVEHPATDPRNIVVPTLDVTFAAPINSATFNWQDLTLTRDGGPNLITSAVAVTPVSAMVYRVSNFNWVVGQEGEYTFTAVASGVLDLAGNSGSGLASTTWTMDTTRPATASGLAVAPDLGVSNNDSLINTLAPTLTGLLGETNLTVRVKDLSTGQDYGTAVVTAKAFSKSLSLSTAGSHQLEIRAVDAAGNTSFPDARLDVFVDIAQPSAEITPVIPDVRDTAVPALTVTFSEAVNPATFTRNDLTLRRQNGANLINSGVTVSALTESRYQISGLTGLTDTAGNYEFALNMATVEDRAGNAGTNTVAVTWARTGANQPPTLAAIAGRSARVGDLITFTNVASDPDAGQSLRFSMNLDAPDNARLGETSGVFAWTPTRSQSPGVYTITITVTDDGVPPASSSQSFVVGVEDYTETSLAETVLLAGENGALNVTLISTAGLTNLVAEVAVPMDRLTTPQLGNLSALVSGSSLTELGAGRYRMSLTSQPGQSIRGSNVLAKLAFGTEPAQSSAFVKLPLSNIAARQPDGSVVGTTFVRDGRVVMIGEQPLLELLRGNGPMTLRLFARPGGAWDLQQTAALGESWEKLERLRFHDRELQMPLTAGPSGSRFYRLAAVDVSPPFFEILSFDAGGMDAVLYSERGLNFDIETINNLNLPWSVLKTQSMTNQFHELRLDVPPGGAVFLKATAR